METESDEYRIRLMRGEGFVYHEQWMEISEYSAPTPSREEAYALAARYNAVLPGCALVMRRRVRATPWEDEPGQERLDPEALPKHNLTGLANPDEPRGLEPSVQLQGAAWVESG